jgi:hypothetical protein
MRLPHFHRWQKIIGRHRYSEPCVRVCAIPHCSKVQFSKSWRYNTSTSNWEPQWQNPKTEADQHWIARTFIK